MRMKKNIMFLLPVLVTLLFVNEMISSEKENPQGQAKQKEKDKTANNYNFSIGDKKRKAFVVLGKSLSQESKVAATKFCAYIEKITGVPVHLDNNVPSPLPDALNIHIGNTDYVDSSGIDAKDLFIDGYIIKLMDDNNLVILGGKHLGTGIGIYDFLKIFCGVRWFMPGPLGEVIPEKNVITLHNMDIRSEPSVKSVWIRDIQIDYLKVKSFRRYHWAGHNLHSLIPQDKYTETHPEYFALINGERRTEGMVVQPCVSNPDLPKLINDVAREYFKKNPYSQVFSVGVNDGGRDCLCDKCQALDFVENNTRNMADRYIWFYNKCAEEFAKEFPDKLLGFSAYGGVASPPCKERLVENCYVRIAPIGSSGLPQFEAWSKHVKHMGVYEYLYGRQILEPRHYPHVLANYLKTLVNKYHILSFAAEFFPFWPFDACRHYVLSELLWDIDKDTDKLIDDFFNNFYWESASPMKAFFDRIEKIYQRRDDPCFFFDGFRTGGFGEWELADLECMDSKLDEAKKLACDEKVKMRIKMVSDAYEHIKCWLNIHIYTRKIETLLIKNQEDIHEAINYAENIVENMNKRKEWDKKVLDKTQYSSDEYYKFYVPVHYANPDSTVQTDSLAFNAIDTVFTKISQWYIQHDNWKDAEKLWEELHEKYRDTLLANSADAQICLHKINYKPENIIADSSFEEKTGEIIVSDVNEDIMQKYGWKRYNQLPHGYACWTYSGNPVRFVWTDKFSHNGKYSIGIENNVAGSASIIKHIPVKANEKYLCSVYVQKCGGLEKKDLPTMSVAWQNKNGWTKASRLTIISGNAETWSKIECNVTVPPGASCMVIMLSANKQEEGEGTYFDDLYICKTYEQAENKK